MEAYANSSCQQLAQAEIQASQQLENLSAAQRSADTGDTIGVLLIGLPLSSMGGGDREAQIVIERGKMQAIDRYQAARSC
ncbi:hypothetical protein ACXN5S_05715 [Pseudoroseicyclus sp. H15]